LIAGEVKYRETGRPFVKEKVVKAPFTNQPKLSKTSDEAIDRGTPARHGIIQWKHERLFGCFQPCLIVLLLLNGLILRVGGSALLLETNVVLLLLDLLDWHIFKDWFWLNHLKFGFESRSSTGLSRRIAATTSVAHVDREIFHLLAWVTPEQDLVS
jgi:hypothetical protein